MGRGKGLSTDLVNKFNSNNGSLEVKTHREYHKKSLDYEATHSLGLRNISLRAENIRKSMSDEEIKSLFVAGNPYR